MKNWIKQGDAYDLEIDLTLEGAPVTDSNLPLIETAEFCLGDLRQEYKSDGTGTVTFSGGKFRFPLSQSQTFALREGPVMLDIRVKDVSGAVHGLENMIQVTIRGAISRREL